MRYFSVAIAFSLLAFLLVLPVAAQEDVRPPALLYLTFEPKSIDTSKGPATITVTAHVTDDLSGMRHLALFFRKPGTTQQAQVEFRPDEKWSEIIEGDILDGVHRTTMTLPRYAAYGEWELYYFMTQDWVGNRLDIWKPDDGQDESWLTLYNGFVFAVREEAPQQPPSRLFIPAITIQ